MKIKRRQKNKLQNKEQLFNVNKEPVSSELIVKFMAPFIFMFGLYIQFHGEYSPGGGFQAGVICASAYISYGLIYGINKLEPILPVRIIEILLACGVLIYAFVGVVTMVKGANFLDYNILSSIPTDGQKLGIIIIELGVGVTVFAAMMSIFYAFGRKVFKK